LLKRVGDLKTLFPKRKELLPVNLSAYPTELFNDKGADKLIGEKIRKSFDNAEYDGEVIRKKDDFYRVSYDDGDAEDLEGFEVIRYLWPRPQLPPILMRRFGVLELFAGNCEVSNAFYHQEWDTASHDIDPNSSATIKGDILSLDPETLPFVPDFIWASPPCETYSSEYHRSLNELDRSPVARLHNLIFMKMVQIFTWAKQHPHLIICIETSGNIHEMPLMKEFIRHFGLYHVIIDYSAFEGNEKKSVQLWSNCKVLCEHFKDCKCRDTQCCVMEKHELGQNGVSSIPRPLAKECARVVNSKLTLERVHRLSAAKPARPHMGRPKRECALTNSEH